MSPSDNRELIHRFYRDVVNAHRPEAIDGFIAATIIDHELGLSGSTDGAAAWKAELGGFLDAFPDLAFEVDWMVADADMVVTHVTITGTHRGAFMDVAASGRAVEFAAMEAFRIDGGMVVEYWGRTDVTSLMEQLTASA